MCRPSVRIVGSAGVVLCCGSTGCRRGIGCRQCQNSPAIWQCSSTLGTSYCGCVSRPVRPATRCSVDSAGRVIAASVHNLGRILLAMFGRGKSRGWDDWLAAERTQTAIRNTVESAQPAGRGRCPVCDPAYAFSAPDPSRRGSVARFTHLPEGTSPTSLRSRRRSDRFVPSICERIGYAGPRLLMLSS